MPFQRPTLTELIERARDDINGRLPGADSRVRRSVLDVLSRVQAGGLAGAYGFLDWISRQAIIDTADDEVLERWAAIWGIARKAASAASGNVTVTGTNGVTVPAGAVLFRADGVEFAVAADVVIAGGTGTLSVDADQPGSGGLSDAGVQLTFASPIAGVNAVATVAAGGLAGGADEENDEALRGRLIGRIQKPVSGGKKSDYEVWALEVAGVTRAWVYPGWMGLGTVGVTFVMDDRVNIIPLAGDVDAVADYIDPLRPVTADVVVFAPTPHVVNFTIAAVPATPAVKAAIEEELRDLLRREGEPGGMILLSHIREAISIAAGEVDHTLTVPAGNVVAAAGHLPVFGAITWA